jgi:NAD(P)-dependent dehydrogenase (short-subunit alcohol dehydrogenase family)
MGLEIDLKARVALVTGMNHGIGSGVARMLAKAGASVAGCDLVPARSKSVRAFRQSVEDAGGQAYYRRVDVTSVDALRGFVNATVAQFGRLDIVVSNAGRNFFHGAAGCDETQWQECLDLNLASHWRLAKLCRPHLEATGRGVIIVMASNHAEATIPGCFPYNVAKAALVGLIRSLALEWGPAIRTVGIAPGFIATGGSDETWFKRAPDPDSEIARTISMHPVRRMGTVEEIGAWAAFLASDYCAFASGQTYFVDGGRLAVLQD